MPTQLTKLPSDRLDLLKQAAIAYQTSQSSPIPATEIVEALLVLEKAAKSQRIRYSQTDLVGSWQLCYTTGVQKRRQGGIKLGKGFYLPRFCPATISFDFPDEMPNQGQISNQIQLGRFKIRFTGLAKYQEKQNLLAFDFTELQLWWGDRQFFTQSIRGGKEKQKTIEDLSVAKLPFFTFFVVTETLISARGRGGGLALWIRDAD